jgi:hypothetical protein
MPAARPYREVQAVERRAGKWESLGVFVFCWLYNGMFILSLEPVHWCGLLSVFKDQAASPDWLNVHDRQPASVVRAGSNCVSSEAKAHPANLTVGGVNCRKSVSAEPSNSVSCLSSSPVLQ